METRTMVIGMTEIIDTFAQMNWTYLIGIAVGILNMGYIALRKSDRWGIRETAIVLAVHLGGRALVEIVANA